MAYQLAPMNGWIVIETLDEAGKIGAIYVPGNISNAYRMARVIAVPTHSGLLGEESFELKAGDVVLYDNLGEVEHRLGPQKIKTVNRKNVVAVITEVD